MGGEPVAMFVAAEKRGSRTKGGVPRVLLSMHQALGPAGLTDRFFLTRRIGVSTSYFWPAALMRKETCSVQVGGRCVQDCELES